MRAKSSLKCFDCRRGRLERRVTKVPHEIRGLAFEVEGEASVCTHCGAISIPWDLADEHGRLVDGTYRKLAGILTVEEIKEARKRLRMSQREFAEYLGVGEASVKRWETGVLPDKSSSDLIRLKTDPEAARENWRRLEELSRSIGAAPNRSKRTSTIARALNKAESPGRRRPRSPALSTARV